MDQLTMCNVKGGARNDDIYQLCSSALAGEDGQTVSS